MSKSDYLDEHPEDDYPSPVIPDDYKVRGKMITGKSHYGIIPNTVAVLNNRSENITDDPWKETTSIGDYIDKSKVEWTEEAKEGLRNFIQTLDNELLNIHPDVTNKSLVKSNASSDIMVLTFALKELSLRGYTIMHVGKQEVIAELARRGFSVLKINDGELLIKVE